MPLPHDPSCIFCRIIRGEMDRDNVFWEDEISLGLMDHRPLKPGHALLMPKGHYATMKDLPPDHIGPIFLRAQQLNRAVEIAFGADGSFSGYNTHVSQSVDHFHLHVVPRMFDDKLFSDGRWVRQKISDAEQHTAARDALGATMRELTSEAGAA